jgi:hypothetical protein
LGPYFRGLKFLWEKILSLILKKLGLKLKKIGLIKFFSGPYYKTFWALFIEGPRQWPNWPSHWAGPGPMLTPYYFKFDFKVYDTTKKRAKNER